jgi:hypothetical protein
VLLELRSQVSAQFPSVEKTPVEQTKFLAGRFGRFSGKAQAAAVIKMISNRALS